MGIFSKKYDYTYDNLQKTYDLETDQFYLTKNNVRLENKQLNSKTKRLLKELNKMPEEQRETQRAIARHQKSQIEEFKKRNEEIQKRSLNGWPELQYKAFETLNRELPNNIFSKEVKQFLDELTCEEKNADYLIGIHRIGPSEEHVEDILNNGIRVQGHLMGAAKGNPELSNTVSYYPDNSTIIKEVAFANEYKYSKGSIVVKIPKEDIINEDIYTSDDKGYMYLNSKYIVGYFPIEQDKTIDKIVTKDNIEKYKQIRVEEAEEYLKMEEDKVGYPPPEMG